MDGLRTPTGASDKGGERWPWGERKNKARGGGDRGQGRGMDPLKLMLMAKIDSSLTRSSK